MKSLSEIKRDITSFYSTLQDRVTDFSVGSVTSGIFYAVSGILENVYREVDSVRRQAYVATATGEYLDRLIEGTFQLARTPATRNTGYVTIYADSPLSESVELRFAELSEDGSFIGGVSTATKFIGYPGEGEEGVVYVLTQPRTNTANVNMIERTITLEEGTQYAVLPVASQLRGSRTRVNEGDIYSFPSAPNGIAGVVNTMNPGLVFFSTEEYTGGAPFPSRYTTAREYNESTGNFRVDNAFNFSSRGILEIRRDISGLPNREFTAVYTENPDGTGENISAGLILDYVDSSISTISLKQPIFNANNILPKTTITSGNNVIELNLYSYTYGGTTVINTDDATFLENLSDLIANPLSPWNIRQRREPISNELVFDPDRQLTTDYRLLSTATVSGATDAATDAEYRRSLISYLEGLGRATNSALVAGSLQVPGVSFAATLPKYLAPRGTAVVVASDEDGFLAADKRQEVIDYLEEDWSAAGVNLVVRAPERIQINISMNVRLTPNAFPDAVTRDIVDATENYVDMLFPGDKLRYSQLLGAYNQISGIENVFNLIITKQLTDVTYSENKAEYDELAIIRLSNSTLVEDYSLTTTTSNQGMILVYNQNTLNHEFWTDVQYESSYDSDIYDDLGVIYAVDESNNTVMLLQSTNSPLTYNIMNAIVNPQIDSFIAFRDTLNQFRDDFSGSTEDYYYFLSYILSEPINDAILDAYPVNPEVVKSQNIQDYTSTPLEIFRTNSVTVGQDVRKLIGINYL